MDSLKSESAVAVAANIQQAVNGNLVLGSSRQFVGFDTIVEPDVIRQMLSRCLRFFPKIAGVHAIRAGGFHARESVEGVHQVRR